MINFSLVPFFLRIDQFKAILDELIQLSNLVLVYSDDTLLICYLIYIVAYLIVVGFILRFFYKFIVIFLDKVV